MLLQEILTGIVVLGAAAYLGRLLYTTFRSEKACGGACKCDPVKQART
jgi:hypothetical protein